MKNTKTILLAAVSTAILFGSCSKKSSPATTTVTFTVPDILTPVTITAGTGAQTISVGTSNDIATFNGTAGDNLSYNAQTCGGTTSAPIGELINIYGSTNYPANGSTNIIIAIPTTYFYLCVINNSGTSTITQEIYNYGLPSQYTANVSIPPNGSLTGIGYFQSSGFSNVRLISGTSFWYDTTISLPNTTNQTFTIKAN